MANPFAHIPPQLALLLLSLCSQWSALFPPLDYHLPLLFFLDFNFLQWTGLSNYFRMKLLV